MSLPKRCLLWTLSALWALATPLALADTVRVAVAANFTDAAKEIAAAFAQASGHTAILSFGSSGQLYAQITYAAPFEVFLSADQARPIKAVEEGYALAESRFTYALGKLALWSPSPALPASEATLAGGQFQRLAVANPATAPYGAAALAVLEGLGLYDALRTKLVQGNSISQTYQFIATGNAELGFVALAQLADTEASTYWIVPERLYSPILQDAVLLQNGAQSAAAHAFIAYLKGPEARAIIERYGYGVID